MAVATLPKLVTKADAAEIFGVCVKSIDNYIAQGLLPRPVAFASKEYWHPDAFAAFLERTFKTHADAPQDAGGVDSASQQSVGPVPGHLSATRPRTAESTASLRQRMRQDAKLRQRNA